MRVELTARRVEISPALRRLVERKLDKVLRVVNNAGMSAAVVLFKERMNTVVEVTLHTKGEHFFHAKGKATAWEPAVTEVVDKLLHQAEKIKGKWHERKRRGLASRSVKTPRPARTATARAAAPVTGPGPVPGTARGAGLDGRRRQVLRAMSYSVKPMTVDEAAIELEGQDAPFLVFRDAITDAVNVLYRRDDGQFALIEPEA